MNIVYSGEYNPLIADYSIFLAGPTARKGQTLEWRKEAIQYFNELKFTGNLFVPEPKTGQWPNYEHVIDWELEHLNLADIILFWVPRNIETQIYAFTTNVEFGYHIAKNPTKVFYGRPDTSDNNRYLDFLYRKYRKAEPVNDLRTLVQAVVTETTLC